MVGHPSTYTRPNMRHSPGVTAAFRRTVAPVVEMVHTHRRLGTFVPDEGLVRWKFNTRAVLADGITAACRSATTIM